MSAPGPAPIDPEAVPVGEVLAYVALGSNVGDRAAHLEYAFAAMDRAPGLRLLRRSSVFETAPVGPAGQGPYLNAVAEVAAALSPRGMLGVLLAIEAERGRDRSRESRHGPRTLDLDILAWGEACPGGTRSIDAPGLTVPHPRMGLRPFVLDPLGELAPVLAERARPAAVHSR